VEDNRPLGVITFRDVVAVVSAVRLDTFCGPTAEVRMQDLRWIGPRACRHEEVVELVMRDSPVVPARFATLFSSRSLLLAWLETHYETLAQALHQFASHEEWAVKATLDRRKAEAPLLAAALARRTPSASPGVRYLEERRIRAGIGQELSAFVKELCERLHDEVRGYAAEFRERSVGQKEPETEGTPILNWAFLVSSDRVGEFRACVQRTAAAQLEHGVVIECSGPWPPYSFCPSCGVDDAK
jgi:hypothetical protein